MSCIHAQFERYSNWTLLDLHRPSTRLRLNTSGVFTLISDMAARSDQVRRLIMYPLFVSAYGPKTATNVGSFSDWNGWHSMMVHAVWITKGYMSTAGRFDTNQDPSHVHLPKWLLMDASPYQSFADICRHGPLPVTSQYIPIITPFMECVWIDGSICNML